MVLSTGNIYLLIVLIYTNLQLVIQLLIGAYLPVLSFLLIDSIYGEASKQVKGSGHSLVIASRLSTALIRHELKLRLVSNK